MMRPWRGGAQLVRTCWRPKTADSLESARPPSRLERSDRRSGARLSPAPARKAAIHHGQARGRDRLVRGAVTLEPEKPEYAADLATAYGRAKNFEAGVQAVDDALSKADAEDSRLIAHLFALRARLLLDDGRPSEALDDADRAVQRTDKSAEAFDVRASIRVALDDPEAAIDDLERGILLDPHYEHRGLQRTGTLFASMERLDDAERALIRSLELEPNCANCWGALIGVAVRRGIRTSARSHESRSRRQDDRGWFVLAFACAGRLRLCR